MIKLVDILKEKIDGHDAYNVRDKTKFKKMNSTACEAWLNQRTEGT